MFKDIDKKYQSLNLTKQGASVEYFESGCGGFLIGHYGSIDG